MTFPFAQRLAGLAAVVAAVLVCLASPDRGFAQQWEPLLMQGRQTIFQRVLSRPIAVVREEPDPQAPQAMTYVPPFTIFYVFDRQQRGGTEWVQVGRPMHGPPDGWVQADQVINWRQSLVVSFTNPANRERTLLFRERDEMIDLLESEALPDHASRLRREAIDGALPPDSNVISIEPAEYIDITQEFYILPILQAEDVWLASGFDTRVLEVASIPLETDPLSQMPSDEELLRGFRVGIVFVIDTTNSMGPYIDRTREAVQRIYRQIEGSPIGDRVSFGMIGFRDSIDDVPELEYRTRLFAPLEVNQDSATFLAEIGAMRAATVSSLGFNEDAMAGVHDALNLGTWDEFGGRYVIVITDAGPRQASDPRSATGQGPRQLNQTARENETAIYSLHLLTETGRGDREYAEAAYRELSWYPAADNAQLYYPIDTSEPAAFGRTVDRLVEQLISQVQDTMNGALTEQREDLQDQLTLQSQLVGRAMQLAYLGRQREQQAPDVFRAWVSDRDLNNPRRSALQVRVLVTKNELSTLRDVLRAIVEEGQTQRYAPEEFFDRLQSAVAHIARDPNRLGQQQYETLGDMLGEYLRDLPYQSLVLEIDEDEWLSMGPGRRREIIDDLEAKLRQYQDIHDRVDNWVELYPGQPEGEHVYPMLLESLP